MPKKESSNKAREWERERRERLNETFNLLSTLLPSYDPSITRSKIEILQKAVAYISDLQKENKELVKGGKDQACWKQVRQLKHRMENLLRRVQQLTRLLNDAGISVPPELPKDGQLPLRGRPPKWSNKIRQEDAAALLEKVKSKRANKKKERTPLNASGNNIISNEPKTNVTVSNTSESNNKKTVSTTSKTKLSRVTKVTKVSKGRGKKSDVRKPGCEALPTVTQLLGLSLNDIDAAPTVPPPPQLSGSGELISNHLSGVTSNTAGTNVTVLASNIPQVPQGFIVIPKGNSLPTTSKAHLPQSQCIVVAPASQAVTCSQQNQQPCVVMPSKVQATKVIKTSMPVQQPIPMVLSTTTSALENVANPTVQKSDSAVAVTNSHLLTTPIMATGMQTCSTSTLLPAQGASLTGLGPGTLILANGSILPIFPSPQPATAVPRVLTPRNSTQIVMNSGSNIPAQVLPNPPVLLVQNKAHSTSDVSTSNVKSRRIYSLCLPKPLKRKGVDSTRSNKVPISALTSRSQLIRSIATSAQVPTSKHVNRTGDSRSSKRISDKKNNSIQKGNGRSSKANPKIQNKKKSIVEENIENNLQTCVEKSIGKPIKSGISEIASTNSTAKESVNECIDSNAAKIQINCAITHEILNNISAVDQKCEEDLSSKDCPNKRKRDVNEDAAINGSKQVKYTHETDDAINIQSASSEQSSFTTTNITMIPNSFTNSSVDVQTKKSNEESVKVFGGNDNYSIDSICKSNEKNEHTSDSIISSLDTSEKNINTETSASFQSKENVGLSVVNNNNNNDKAISCDANKLCSTLSYSNLPSTMTTESCAKNDSTSNKQLINSGNDFNASCSPGNSLRCPSLKQSEEAEESNHDICNTATYNDSKHTGGDASNDLKSSANDENCNITEIASVIKSSQMLEESSMTNNIFQQETSNTYSQPVSADVHLFSSKEQNDVSESKASDKTALQGEFGSENAPKIQNDISEHSLHNDSSHLSNRISNEQSPTNVVRVSDIQFPKSSCTVQLDSCKVDNRDNIDNSENIKETVKSPKNDFSGNNNVQSELSSTEYNTFSSVSEGNVSVCSSANKIFRNNENLDLGASASSSLCLSLQNNELSNDLFASLQVPSGGQHAESISPTAAFLLAFPLVSTSKVSDIIGDSQDDVGSDSLQGTSTLLQIGSLDSDHHSEAIISRSPTYHGSNNASKILPQSTLCQKESRSEQQELECQQFLSSASSKTDRNSEKNKVNHIKFSESLDGTEKTSNKNWMALQTPSHSESTSKPCIDESRERNLETQTFTKETLDSQMKNREMTGECTKEKQSCTFSGTKEVPPINCSSGSLNTETSQQTSSNAPSFSESQFVAPIYNSKEHVRVPSIKQDQTPHTSSALQITPDRSINFVNPATSKGEERNFRSYKNLALNTSNSTTTSSSGVSFTMEKSVIEQATMTEDERTSHSNSLESSNKIKQTFSSADCNDYSASSQSGYILSNTGENEKCNIPSFSVAHNSSNFSILSWTTLSPTSTMTNTSQYDGFGASNSGSIAASQNNYLSIPKKQNKNICQADACPIMTSSVPESCQSQMKEALSTHTINKFSESHTSSLLQNSNNQTYLQHFLPDQRKMPTSVAPTSIDNAASQGPQLCANSKVPENEQHHRPPVNWMTTPDVRGSQHPMNLIPSSSVGNRTLPSNSATVSGTPVNTVTSKDNQYCSISSSPNVFISCISSTLPTFDTRTYTSNTFYNTQSVSSQNSQSNCYQNGTHGQGLTEDSNHNNNKLHFTSSLNRITDVHMGQTQLNETYSVPWLQKKPNPSSVCSTESSSSNFISSSLPTLVGDLALGTNYPLSVNDDEQGSKGASSSVNFHAKMTEKKSNVCNSGNNSLEQDQSKQMQSISKNNDHIKDRGAIKNSVQEFRNTSSQSSSSSFLSVSQLVNQAHSCENSTREHTISRESSHISNRVILPNKNTSHSQSHQITNLSATLEEPKEQISSLSSSDKEMNRKPHPEIDQSCVSIRTFESRISLPQSREGEARRKIEPSQVRGSNHYIQEITNSVTPSHNSNSTNSESNNNNSNSNSTFSVTSSTQASSTLSNVSWPSGNVVKHRSTKGSSSSCKAPASSYSAEALIGLNSQVADRSLGSMSDSRGNKVITLPPPVVSERFCRHQNYPPPSAARPIQVPPPFPTDTILPSNYFTPMELQTSHPEGNSTSSQNVNNSQNNLTSHSHQNQQGFNTFPSSSSQSTVRVSTGQCNSVLYSHSDFMSSVGSAHPSHTLPPVSLPCNFLPDLGSNNSYTSGILSDSGNPFLFPSSTIPVSRGSSTCHSMGGGKQSLTHLHSSTQVTTGAGIGEGHEASNHIVPTLPIGDKEPYSGNSLRCNNGSSTTRRSVTSDTNMLQQNTVESGNICSSSKQRIRKRTTEPVTHSSSSALGGLMDLGYLGIPPVIGSPMLPDEGTFINHSSGFLTPSSQHTTPSLYPGAPTPSQGSFYPAAPSHGQSNTSHATSHASHLPVNSGSFTTQTTRGLQVNNMVSPSVVNSSGTSLTNFNLSTIFPEINEKQVPNNAYNSSGSKETGPLLSSSLPSTAPRPPHSQLNNSSSNHSRQPATLLLPPVSSYAHRQTSGEAAICLPPPPPPPPPVPLHSSVTFNNLLNSTASQMCQMQWR